MYSKEVIKYLCFFLFVTLSCKVHLNPTHENIVRVSHNQERYAGDTILKFTIKNVSNREILLLNPFEIPIEKKINSEWRRIRTLYCPCGASCPPPPAEEIIKKNEQFTFTWNEREEWCSEPNQDVIPETHSIIVKNGLYRLIFKVKSEENIYVVDYSFNVKK